MPRQEINFTKAGIAAIEPPEKGRLDVYDKKTSGLLVRVTPTGAKSFAVYRRVNGVPKRVKIGTFPDMTVELARKAAIKALGKISGGTDPIAEKRAKRARGTTLEDAFRNYLASRNLKPRTVADYKDVFNTTFDDWKKTPLSKITRTMVEGRHRTRSKESPARADNSFRVLRAVFNYAMETLEDEEGNPLLLHNPVKRLSAVKAWNRVGRKQTVIKEHQLPAWFAAVQGLQGERSGDRAATARDYLIFLLLTGLRKLEAAKLRWPDVDFKSRSFIVHDTKNGDPVALPLSDYLLELLRRRHDARETEGYVFATNRRPGYPTEVRWWLRSISEKSGIEFTLHDLRRTFATTAESLDIPAYALKKLLNHRSGRRDSGDVTEGYVVADVERLRRPMQKITDYLLSAGKVRPNAAVVALDEAREGSAHGRG